jgi:diguanylate cyclase (GGDEF)-like protein/PAS domain S-box-containing protein
MALFLLYGPASRLLMACCLLTGLLTYRNPHHLLQNRIKVGFWLSWIMGFLILDILVGYLAITQSESIAVIRIGMEGCALLFTLTGIAFIFIRRVQSWMKLIYLISLAYLAESSFVFIFAKPWNHLWWLAHLISAAGFTVLSFGVIRAFHTTRAFSLVFSQEEVMNQLAVAKALSEKNEANLRAILDNSPYLTWLKDAEGRYIKINKVFADYIKLGDAIQAEGKTDLDLNPKELAEKYRADDAEVMASRKRKYVEEPAFDGKEIHWIETYKTPVIDAQGKVLGTVGFAQDITERKLTETELRISSVAFESQEAMIITNPKGVILRVNKAFTDSTGYSAEEAVGRKPNMLKSGHHDADFYRSMWETLLSTGAWQGEIWDRRKNGEVYPKWLTISAVKDAAGVVTHYVGSHFDITERKRAEEQIKSLAFYDHLTSLPNRRLLLDRLHQALASSGRSGRNGALLFIDLDNFKSLNDTLGHNIGDLLLQQVAQRLEQCVREGDTVARLGGDEFVVLLEDLSKESLEAAAQAKGIGEKILVTLNQPYYFGAQEHHNTPSIGITLFNEKQQTSEELFKQADLAMYQAKKEGRNALRFFDPQMQESINARSSIEGELRKALENQEFHLYYQVQTDSSLRPFGAEALIRWIHPERGLVPPVQFISLAEETGLILSIGGWVLETACAQLKSWQQREVTRNLILSINVSAKQFHQANFVAEVKAAVQRHEINPQLLKLELTESMLLEKIEETIATMNALKAIGVKISLDDFGTGFSSLQYLKRLPLTQLKIDQTFVRDLATDENDKAIAQTIIAMAQSLKLDVIAEGVETVEQREFLESAGCHHYQGYLFGKPVPIVKFEASLGKAYS